MGNGQGNLKGQISIDEGDVSSGDIYHRKDDAGKSSTHFSQVIPLSTSSSGRTTPDVTSADCVAAKSEVSEATVKGLLRKSFSSDKFNLIPGSLSDLTHHYSLKRELRRGHSGRVCTCFNKGSAEFLACKSVCKKTILTENSLEDLLSEIGILRQFPGNSNILELLEVYEDKKAVHLVRSHQPVDVSGYM